MTDPQKKPVRDREFLIMLLRKNNAKIANVLGRIEHRTEVLDKHRRDTEEKNRQSREQIDRRVEALNRHRVNTKEKNRHNRSLIERWNLQNETMIQELIELGGNVVDVNLGDTADVDAPSEPHPSGVHVLAKSDLENVGVETGAIDLKEVTLTDSTNAIGTIEKDKK